MSQTRGSARLDALLNEARADILGGRFESLYDRKGTERLIAEYDWREPVIDELMRNEGEVYDTRIARAWSASWVQSEPTIGRHELIVGVQRPHRAFATIYNQGVVLDRRFVSLLEGGGSPAYRAQLAEKIRYAEEHDITSADEQIERECRRVGIEARNAVYLGNGNQAHMVIDFGKLLQTGVAGIREEIEHSAVRFPEGSAERSFLQMLLIMNRGFERFIARYAECATRLAETEGDPRRREELDDIARICRRVSLAPPETFREALQLFWFSFLWDEVDNPGRMDYYLKSHYETDKQRGLLGPDGARELLSEVWIKFGITNTAHLCAGGTDESGEDITNDLTYLLIDCEERFRFGAPMFTVRMHPHSPEQLWDRIIEVNAKGSGKPAAFNDEAILKAFSYHDVPVTDARNYGFGGCSEVLVCGKSNTGAADGEISVAKCLELALFDGVDPADGIQIGPETGNAVLFDTYDELWDAYREQVEWAADTCCTVSTISNAIKAQKRTKAFKSMLVDSCIARGRSADEGGAQYGYGSINIMGSVVVADSLAAIRSLVYEKRSVPMAELIEALRADFLGHEELRRRLLAAPKFGNDDPYADTIARQVTEHVFRYLRTIPSPRRGYFAGGIIPYVQSLTYGRRLGATPDGRRKGEPLEDSACPRAGMDMKGPTASLSSSACIPQDLALMGVARNIKFTPEFFSHKENRDKMKALIRTYFRKGGQQVQLNVIDNEVLRQAKAEPEKHRNLLVRVGGYSDYFIKVPPGLQDQIMQRNSML